MKSFLIAKGLLVFIVLMVAFTTTNKNAFETHLIGEPRKVDSINNLMELKLDSLKDLKNRYITKANIIEYKIKAKSK